MAKLPFVVRPRLSPVIERIGNEEVGIIEIERRGYLSAQEKNFTQQFETSDRGTSAVIKLSRKIGAKYSISLDKAYAIAIEAISGQFSPENKEYSEKAMEDFQDEIAETMSSLSMMQTKSEIVEALCLLIHRVNSDITPDDILDVHPDIISGLSALYKDELVKSIERIEQLNKKDENDKEPTVEEIEKKRRRKEVDG
jgi:hypothetical protein